MLSKHFKSEKGMALAVVLMVLAVLSILSVGALAMTQTENKLSLEEKESINSYAISKSGLEIVSKKLQKDPSQIAGLLIDDSSLTGTIGRGKFNVELSGALDSTLKLKSKGVIDYNTQYSFLELINLSDPSSLFKNAVYSNAALDLNKATVSGPLQSATTIFPPSTHKNSLTATPGDLNIYTEKAPMTWPLFNIPLCATGDPLTWIKDRGKESAELNKTNTRYENLFIDSSQTLTIKNTNPLVPLNLVVKNFTIKGTVKIKGKVNLFVTDTLWIQANADLINESDADANNLFIFLGKPDATDLIDGFNPNGTFHFQADVNMNGYIYGPAAFVQYKSEKAFFNGGIICNVFESNAKPTITYKAPTSNPGGLNGIINTLTKSKYTDQ